ncbi:hypothetical protein [Clostridium aminobutyricum]|uniref:Uncharacterized protein n=1 Tax=Clostridium aminobutyricum TaxID=33953 RepID=A0A939D6L3_CLOAM|nr:hypothetical protein [Clostridium aminobutyricum]MBN7772384.1 hypothetical protein [Clostridium aminobutyricum]
MSCFGNRVSPDLYQNCCNANTLCEFSGNINDLVTEPLYVQKVYDAVLFNLQGMKTVQNQRFTPNIPRNHRVKRVIDIRCKRFFNPANIDDPRNLKLELNTSISGATFLQNAQGQPIQVVGPDGTFSEKILFADTTDCDDQCMGTPIFGTQNISVTGNVQVFVDLLLCDRNNNEVVFTVCTDVNVATATQPLVLTNFFEICMPSTIDTAFLPRFTEFCNTACETRLATNNMGRDLSISQNGEVSANLIIAICITCEKKIVVPVQLCVLSTGFAQISPQVNAICTTFPTLFPQQIKESDTLENCGEVSPEEDEVECVPCCVPCCPVSCEEEAEESCRRNSRNRR